MLPSTRYIDAVAQAAKAWADPAYEARNRAVAQTLGASNRFTEEAIAFAINQRMHRMTSDGLRAWVGEEGATTACRLCVFDPGHEPMGGLRTLVAVVLTGHMYQGVCAKASPYLVPAFVDEVRRHAPDLPVAFYDAASRLQTVDALVARGADEQRDEVKAVKEAYALDERQCLVEGRRYAVAVVDGHEDEEAREGLAEDVLLHEGLSPHNAALLWAPRDLVPDPYLESFAAFRGVFPAHPDTPGALEMQRAFLAAQGAPHAYGDGLEFLVSRGAPEVQVPGHVRWTEYDDLSTAVAWLTRHHEEVSVVVARSGLHDQLAGAVPIVTLGEAHRSGLDQADGLLDFLLHL